MKSLSKHQKHPAFAVPGNTVAEYGILLGLVALVCVGAVMALGTETDNMISQTAGNSVIREPMTMLTGGASSSQVAGSSSGVGFSSLAVGNDPAMSYQLQVDATTGKLQITNAAGEAVNTTSVEGIQLNTLGSAQLAYALEKAAGNATTPESKQWLEGMAKLSYYLGGAQGEIDAVNGLELSWDGDKVYTNGSALRDIVQLQQELGQLIESPPAGASAQEIATATALGSEVYNIAQEYKNAFSKYIKADAEITDFTVTGSNQPGDGLREADKATTGSNFEMTDKSYAELVPYEELKARALKVLSDNSVESLPLKATLKNAMALDNASSRGKLQDAPGKQKSNIGKSKGKGKQ